MGEENDFSAPLSAEKESEFTFTFFSYKKVIKNLKIIIDKFLWA